VCFKSMRLQTASSGAPVLLPHPEPRSGPPPMGSAKGLESPALGAIIMMISLGDGGPPRTRTWVQGIMSNRIPSLLLLKVEKAETLFRCPSRAAVPTELIPNAQQKSKGKSR